MGTREVYEEKLRRGNLHHDPTINPGLGLPRCPRCLSTLNPTSVLVQDKGEWAITSVLHDATAVAGSGIGGMLSAIHGINTGIPYLQNLVKGPKWLPFLVGLPPLLIFSGASAAFGGYALPRFAQLTVTSYYAASSASHYGISLLTRHIEESHTSRTQQEKLR
ncbi:Transmembrane protein [Parasponia andersonii]|uniref:Transmembrane protein n=1 Tax=Parasponia andersonii TaxID=3476 RepID=A0A2P5AMR8_PARAD|nr:Transmembrane protein [Parasponia andersonii]